MSPSRDELLTLMRSWGWRMESEWPGRYQVWENPGGGTAIVPSDPELADYGHILARAWETLAFVDAPRLLGVVREVAALRDDLRRAFPDPTPYTTEATVLDRLDRAVAMAETTKENR